MKRFTCALIVLALAVLVLPVAAQAVEISFFRGKTASVEFYATDPAGCFVTSITVFASDNRYSSPPAPSDTEAWADVTIHLFNGCTGEQSACGAGSFALPDGAFNVAGNLASATLNAAGEIHDFCTGTDRPITLALTWTGVGDLGAGRSHYSMHSSGYHAVYRQSGQQREATIDGGMTLDGTPLLLDNGSGYLTKTSNGTIFRSR
jgi:hypothetical protein